ncbi:hypothetical protein AQUCO_04800006v1 [Aquilegia coerulea]|uniref:Pentacotripeptide-repeat region of PRORP domain-containing protein n=1 Tax=Aquilegia coerulea TaxID=218851 RepID=A0A2G5CKK6_AQUCA|nr:hypothetical protein AQUCO_04800006v1 [Aquilegia coerulea]
MEKRGIKRSTKSFNALLRAGNFARKYVEVSKIFDEYPEKYGIKPDLDTYNIVIESFVDRVNLNLFLRVFEEMDKNGVEPDEITLNTSLNGFNRQQKYDEAEKVLKIFEKLGPQLGLHNYNSKIRKLCDMGKTMEAEDVFEKISSRGMKLNRYTYQCLLFAYYKDENVEETRRFFNEMYENGFEPDFIYSTYKNIIRFLCQGGDFETAAKLWLESIGKLDLAHELGKAIPHSAEMWNPSSPM